MPLGWLSGNIHSASSNLKFLLFTVGFAKPLAYFLIQTSDSGVLSFSVSPSTEFPGLEQMACALGGKEQETLSSGVLCDSNLLYPTLAAAL